jgi:hypothetical protein
MKLEVVCDVERRRTVKASKRFVVFVSFHVTLILVPFLKFLFTNITAEWSLTWNKIITNVYSINMGFNAWANSIDPDQPGHICHLIGIYTVCFLVRNNLMHLKAHGTDVLA